MRILFNILAKIEVPDVDEFFPRVEVEKELTETLKNEGMIVHGLAVTNYGIHNEKQEDD